MATAVYNSWPWSSFLSPIQLCFLFVFFFFVIYFPHHATVLSFIFTNINQTLVKRATSVSNLKIIPTNQTWKAGRALYKDLLHLWDKASGTLTDIDTYFSFVIDSQGNSSFRDGLTFVLLPNNSTLMNADGAAIGLPILSIFSPISTPFVVVEFDTFQNGQWDPLDITPITHMKNRAHQEDGEFSFNMSMDNDFEAGTGPKRFSYSELFHATNKFANKLGHGGFGEVYRGFLKESKSNVAVKRISKGSKQGLKEYASKVKIISRLRHRNLV
ncbi:L-type lectin-domain containing receptor kinase IX.1-like [Camellia sinensis]|uniref:L-type lectin-domain containing receptor kinase IX.1-like n=1 Tax=Camellia sinensis TaxID=4442 RepID=UPI001035B2AD|nr:L-type lectin-domain containing receptor kinase IX.1-like [Camellia sinensis]